MTMFKFYLKPGQTPPVPGSTSMCLTDGGIVFEADEWPDKDIEAYEFKDEDTKEWAQLQDFLKIEQPVPITFEEYRNPDVKVLEAKMTENTTKLTAITSAKVATDAKVSAEVVKGE